MLGKKKSARSSDVHGLCTRLTWIFFFTKLCWLQRTTTPCVKVTLSFVFTLPPLSEPPGRDVLVLLVVLWPK